MIRTLNYTGRKRIPRSQIQLGIDEPDKASRNLDVAVKLDDLALPSAASVYVEAYGRAGVKRYSFGKVGKFAAPSDLTLPNAVSLDNLLFRVLVVDESGTVGRIVAAADRLRLTTAEKGPTRSILPVETTDLGRLVWRIDFGGERPTLLLNENIPDVMHLAATDVRFFEYVYPAVLKEILTHMVWIDGMNDLDTSDTEDWKLQWLRFTEQYVQAQVRPELDEEIPSFDSEAAGQWIEDVVNEFCTKNVDVWDALLKEVEVPEQ